MQALHNPAWRSFASDNYAGAHPEVLSAVLTANGGHQVSYGGDAYTAALQQVMADHFGPQIEVFPVFNGTAANVLSLQALLPRWGGVVCGAGAHANTDEGGAPEQVAGLKLLTVATPDGKLSPELIDEQAWGWGDEHRTQPLAVSITESSELGTVYTPAEIAEITSHVHHLGMKVHMDGARIANAAATLDVPLRAITTDVGVDVLSFGGTKNGLLFGEAVVVLDPEAVAGLAYLRKADMQLASKMRYISAQLVALLEGDLWLRSARHANAMARRLAGTIGGIDGLQILHPVEANAVFATLPIDATARLRERYSFYDWGRRGGAVRWMCAHDTTPDDVDAFAAAIRAEVALTLRTT